MRPPVDRDPPTAGRGSRVHGQRRPFDRRSRDSDPTGRGGGRGGGRHLPCGVPPGGSRISAHDAHPASPRALDSRSGWGNRSGGKRAAGTAPLARPEPHRTAISRGGQSSIDRHWGGWGGAQRHARNRADTPILPAGGRRYRRRHVIRDSHSRPAGKRRLRGAPRGNPDRSRTAAGARAHHAGDPERHHALPPVSVARRAREFGIRVALGATHQSILRLVMGEATRLIAAGVVAGVVLAMLSRRFLSGLLYGVTASDPAVYVVTIAVLVGAGIVACWIPARRAAHADPAAVLREE